MRTATFNVHGWADASGRSNHDRVGLLIKNHELDIVCLQEAPSSKIPSLGLPYFIHSNNCAIVSKYRVTKVMTTRYRTKTYTPRYVTGLVEVPGYEVGGIYVTCLHLHHKKEDVRKEEWRTIMDDHNQAKLAATRKPLIAHIYAGDFNSLMRIDYDDATWAQIGQIRQQNRWEGCREEVTAMVTAAEGRLQDAKTPTTFRGNLSTCRFGTRIDYIFITDSLFKYCKRLVQVPTEEISDHNLVVCEINRPRK